MKRPLLILLGVLWIFCARAQLMPRIVHSIPDASTQFGVNIPIGDIVFNVALQKLYVCIAATKDTATLTTRSGHFVLMNKVNGISDVTSLQDSLNNKPMLSTMYGYLNSKASTSHNHDGTYLKLLGGTLTGLLTAPASTSSQEAIVIPHGTAPSTPTNGSLWTTTAGMYVQINGSTVGPLGAGGGGVSSVSGTAPIVSSGGTTPAISITQASSTSDGYLSHTDWATFNGKGSGTVTSVSGTAPIISSGGNTPAISITQASSTSNGFLTYTDWLTFNGKQAAITKHYGNIKVGLMAAGIMGSATMPDSSILFTANTTGNASASMHGYLPALANNTTTYLRGDGTWATPAGGGTVTDVTGTAPIISSGGATPAISITQATTSSSGYLSNTDWNTFNNKANIDAPAFTGVATGIGLPVYAVCSGNQTTSSATLVDVPTMTIALQANATYELAIIVTCYSSTTSGGIRVGVNYSAAGATIESGWYSTSSNIITGRLSSFNTITTALILGNYSYPFHLFGIVTTGANAGNLTFEFLKVTSGYAQVYNNSYMKVTRIQ